MNKKSDNRFKMREEMMKKKWKPTIYCYIAVIAMIIAAGVLVVAATIAISKGF